MNRAAARTRWAEVRRAADGTGKNVVGIAAASAGVAGLEALCLSLTLSVLEAFRPESADRLVTLAVLLAGAIMARAGVGYVLDLLAVRLHLRVLLALRERLARAFYSARHADIALLGPGRIVNMFSVQTERVASALSAMISLAGAGLLLVVYVVVLVALSWRLSLAAGAIMVAGSVVAWFVRRRITAAAEGMVRADETSSGLAADDAGGHAVIQVFDAGAARLDLHRNANEDVHATTMALHRWRHAIRPLSDATYALILLGALLLAVRVAPGQLFGSATAILAFAVVLARFQGQLAVVLDSLATLAEQEGAAANVFTFVSEAGTNADPANVMGARTAGAVSVESVSFAYRAGEPVLEGADLRMQKGEIVAVVGESGAGKSTLAQLLVRLRQPAGGRITIDGQPIERFSPAALASMIGVVFEDAFVFDESLEWNVTLGRSLAGGAVAQALELAAASEIVAALPRGLRTVLGSRGATLSAGQRQRIALARALAGAPAILVLDEATSGVDAPTESRIIEALQASRHERMTLVIAHRLSTVLGADRVAVLADGRVMATGTHADLLENNEVYRRLVETQLVSDRLTV